MKYLKETIKASNQLSVKEFCEVMEWKSQATFLNYMNNPERWLSHPDKLKVAAKYTATPLQELKSILKKELDALGKGDTPSKVFFPIDEFLLKNTSLGFKELANECGIHFNAFYNKRKEPERFTVKELLKLSEVFNISFVNLAKAIEIAIKAKN